MPELIAACEKTVSDLQEKSCKVEIGTVILKDIFVYLERMM